MAWSYSNPGACEKDAVRFLIQDTDTNRQLATDEEITWLLSQEANAYMAAAAALEAIINRQTGIKSKSVGDLSITYDTESAKERVKMLKARGRQQYEVPSMPSMSKDEKESLREDTDWVEPAITRGIHDHPEVRENDQDLFEED